MCHFFHVNIFWLHMRKKNRKEERENSTRIFHVKMWTQDGYACAHNQSIVYRSIYKSFFFLSCHKYAEKKKEN